jgi:hypothetical protein
VALVREWTVPTERPPLVGEVSANFCGWRGVAWSGLKYSVFPDVIRRNVSLLASYLACSLTLKMKVTCLCKCQSTFPGLYAHYIPEDGTVCNHYCENLRSFTLVFKCYRWLRLFVLHIFSALFVLPHNFSIYFLEGLPLWFSGQCSWLQIQRSWVRFPTPPDFLRSGFWMGSIRPHEYNCEVTWNIVAAAV